VRELREILENLVLRHAACQVLQNVLMSWTFSLAGPEAGAVADLEIAFRAPPCT
jgi:hypothetical protein